MIKKSIYYPTIKNRSPIEKILIERRTRRCFLKKKTTFKEISQIIFSAQGITSVRNKIKFKTTPSAGAIYPLILYLSSAGTEIENGIYRCESEKMIKILEGDRRKEILTASPEQIWLQEAPITIIICVNFNKIKNKYKSRGEIFSFIEIGHMTQNILLQSTSLEMGGVCVGGFNIKIIRKILKVKNIIPLYLISLGKVSKKYNEKKEISKIKECEKILKRDIKYNSQ